MAQPIRTNSRDYSFAAPSATSLPGTVTPQPAVFVRTEQAPSILLVKKNCHEPDHFAKVFEAHKGQAIHTLEFRYSDMQGAMWLYLLQAMDKAPAVNTLNLSCTHLDMHNRNALFSFSSFMDRLETMPSTLILRGCSINTKGIEPIAKRLAVDKQLQKLDLAENRLGPADIQSLADALRHNETLRSLNLAGNELGTGAVQALINLVHNAKSLRHLDVSAAVLTAEDKVALQQANAFRQGEPLDLVM